MTAEHSDYLQSPWKRPQVGEHLRITHLRDSDGLWWAQVTSHENNNGLNGVYMSVLCGPPVWFNGHAADPPMPHWVLGAGAKFVRFEQGAELPDDFYIAMAKHALLGAGPVSPPNYSND